MVRPPRSCLPAVTGLYNKQHTNGLEISGDTLDGKHKQVDSLGINHRDRVWPQYYDGNGSDNQLALKYAVIRVSLTILIGTDGEIIAINLRGKTLPTPRKKPSKNNFNLRRLDSNCQSTEKLKSF